MPDIDIDVNLDTSHNMRVLNIEAPTFMDDAPDDPTVIYLYLTTHYTDAEGTVVPIQNGCKVRKEDAANMVAALLEAIQFKEGHD